MKANELRPCDLCGKGLMHTGVPLFYLISFDRMAIDINAVRERAALTMLFQGGNTSPVQQTAAARLAEVFAPTGDVAKRLGHESDTLMVCERCSLDFEHPLVIAELAERAAHRRISMAAEVEARQADRPGSAVRET